MQRVTVITGNIASGKSWVSEYLTTCGFRVVSADDLVHARLQDPRMRQEITQHLPDTLQPLAKKDFIATVRQALFSDRPFSDWYLPWVHAWVAKDLKTSVDNAEGALFLDVPLYFERRHPIPSVHSVWLVWTPPLLRLHRWQARTHAPYEAMKQVEQWQIPDCEKFALVDVILMNTGDLYVLRTQVDHALMLG